MTNCQVSDEDILDLKYFPRIKTLLLGDNEISDESVVPILQGCSGLKKLFLNNTLIAEVTLTNLHRLKDLRCLDVRSNELTDQAMEWIAKCKNLVQLSISNN